ncbi:energy-coupling factor transporter transmembrane component T [Nocardioides sp.]|uniref:energy-coupling factor transporter transmembrane component T n=1 Tax=Nocardioides sp. TaxID=35761 RepID=UPI00273280B9|nr:energy-coupling factor transporter transmembrane component T [Nocardioides sp.]MDP3891397.1 energy-coupling factor transporter transmembrane component T [Nocardioides sp.]
MSPLPARLPRDLHPVAWWLWALGLAAGASMTTNPLLLGLLVAVASLVVAVRRSDHPWSRSFRIYLWIGLAIVVIRVLFRILMGGGYGTRVLFTLPEIPLPDWVLDVQLLGAVTQESLLAGLYDGMRLATIVICIGAANALANPKRLLKSVPPALYEIGTALVVAVTVLPQLADSVRRVRAAQALRPGPTGRVGRLRRFLVPVLEDALERSLQLAAGMDARGYGRSAGLTVGQRRVTGALMLGGLIGVCIGVYAVLDTTAPRYLALPLLLGGLLVALLGMANAGRRVERSRYRPDRWRAPEIVIASAGLLVGALLRQVSRSDLDTAYPSLLAMPEVTLLALLAVLLGALPALVAPPAATVSAREAARDTAPVGAAA